MSNEVKILTGIGIVTLVIVVGAALAFGGNSSPDKATPKLSETQIKKLIKPESHIKETKNAKLTLVEFGDYQCPACGQAYPVVTMLLDTYKEQVKFVFRNYPLPMHQNAKAAAEAAEAAGAQGKYFEMYDALYANQQEWGEQKDPLPYFKKYAKNIGLDVDAVIEAIKTNKYEDIIQKDIADGNSIGVAATPTFILNGEKITGGLPYDEFKAKIDAALKTAK